VYPNPQDVLPLPPHPDLDQYRTRAKELAAACRSGDEPIRSWATEWIAALVRLQPAVFRPSPHEIERRTGQVAHFARERLRRAECSLSQAQFVIARAHGFESWRRLVQHLEGLGRRESEVSTFERAAEAIVTGELPTLQRLLREDPALVRARSSREHRATLLHYVSANGVESYRQRTPDNILEIARHLLDAGAEVDAVADVYGGLTTFALVVTSESPRRAGVQNDLADLLLARGARMPPDIVRYCLVNGCPEAAAHLAQRGAPVDVVGAAGIGRLDLVRQVVEAPGGLSEKDGGAAMVMAAWYRRHDVIALLLDHGVTPGARRDHDGQTALHVAAYQGDTALVELLLRHRAPLEVTDAVYGTPPMVWALHAWLVENRPDSDVYAAILRALAAAGAKVKREWLDRDRIRADGPLYTELLRYAGEE
jgi:Ankyrin repeats (many copies)